MSSSRHNLSTAPNQPFVAVVIVTAFIVPHCYYCTASWDLVALAVITAVEGDLLPDPSLKQEGSKPTVASQGDDMDLVDSY